MIFPISYKDSLNKTTLAELATKLGNDISRKLGSKEKIDISTNEIVYDSSEARDIFLNSYPLDRDRLTFTMIEWLIAIERGFCINGIAYTPLSRFSEDDADVTIDFLGLPEGFNLNPEPISDYVESKVPYFSIRDFASEIGHLVGYKLYGNKVSGAFGEVIDIYSRLYEISLDIQKLAEVSEFTKKEIKVIEKQMRRNYITACENELEVLETLFYKGDEAAKQKMSELFNLDGKESITALNGLMVDYVTTNHKDASTMATMIYHLVGDRLDGAFLRLGKLFENPEINNLTDCLRELDHLLNNTQTEKVRKYIDIFEKIPFERAVRINFI